MKPEIHLSLIQSYKDSKNKIDLLENRLNFCTSDKIDELIYELKAEQSRFERIKRELAKEVE